MSEGRLFIITELAALANPATVDDGERFEWSADMTAPGPKGGARACPRAPWTIGGTMHTVRTDYPGATTPSEQVLGYRRKPFTLEGRFLDKYNFAGYAEQEMERFESLCKRGNRCRFQYGTQVLEGIITEWDFPYHRPWDVRYSFTVSVHNRPEDFQRNRAPTTVHDAVKAYDDTDVAIQSMLDIQERAPRTQVAGSLVTDTDALLAQLTISRESLAATIDNREVLPTENPVDAFARVATQFRQVRGDAYNILLDVAEVRSDLDMSVQTAIGVLQFEDWIRSLRFAARLAMGRARDGDRGATERASPNAVRLYRPRKGENLYSISRRFYGTPHAWRLIYERNALRTFTLLGTETLIIPERGGI